MYSDCNHDLHDLPAWAECPLCLRSRLVGLQIELAFASDVRAGQQHRAEIAEARLAEYESTLPKDARYLDPPDGGDVPMAEQFRRMARDAARLAEAEALLRELGQRADRHFEKGVYWVRMYHDEFERIDAFLKETAP